MNLYNAEMEVLGKYSKEFVTTGRFYFASTMPYNLRFMLKTIFRMQENPKNIMAFYDTTPIGKSKTGIVFTRYALYRKTIFGEVTTIYYQQIKTVEAVSESQLCFHMWDGSVVTWMGISIRAWPLSACIQELKQLKQAQAMEQDRIRKEQEAKESSSLNCAALKKLLKDRVENCRDFDCTGKCCTAGSRHTGSVLFTGTGNYVAGLTSSLREFQVSDTMCDMVLYSVNEGNINEVAELTCQIYDSMAEQYSLSSFMAEKIFSKLDVILYGNVLKRMFSHDKRPEFIQQMIMELIERQI